MILNQDHGKSVKFSIFAISLPNKFDQHVMFTQNKLEKVTKQNNFQSKNFLTFIYIPVYSLSEICILFPQKRLILSDT